MTQQNAALMEEAAAASESIVEQVRALNEMVAGYRLELQSRGSAGEAEDAEADDLEDESRALRAAAP